MDVFIVLFDSYVWMVIFLSVIIVVLVIFLFEWNSLFGLNLWGRKWLKNYILGLVLVMVYFVLFGYIVSIKFLKFWFVKVF